MNEPPNIALQRTPSASPPSPLSFGTLGAAIILLVVMATVSCGEKGPELSQAYASPGISSRLVGSAPRSWSLVETKEDQVPWGHHWSDGYKGHGGTKLTLLGPNPVNFHWRDQTGQGHDDPIARESLEIWVLPPEYREGRWGVHDPVPAGLVVATRTTRIYARPAHRLNSESEFETFLKKATETSWPGSPHNGGPLSWKTWKVDLASAAGGA